MTSITVSGKMESDDQMFDLEVVDYDRAFKAPVSPTGATTGCAFMAVAGDRSGNAGDGNYFSSNPCIRKGDRTSRNGADPAHMDRCCKSSVREPSTNTCK